MRLTVDGRVAYAYSGGKAFDAALPCVVFVHGALHDHSVWNLPARWFAHHGHAVLAVDQPGHGRSDGPPLADIGALADWLLGVLDAAGVDRAALVGHSMGSLIALEAAARAPRRATRLVLVGTAFPMRVSPALLEMAETTPQAAMAMVNALSHSGLAAKPGCPGPGTWLHGANLALMRRLQAADPTLNLFRHDFGVCDAYAGGIDAAARVSAATTLILGRRDQMTVARQAEALGAALRAQVVTIDCGHALMSEAPDAVLAALRGALD